jgi:hypothetical protein
MLSFYYSCSFNHKQIPGFTPVLYKEFSSISKKISLLFFILHEVPFSTLQDQFQLFLLTACTLKRIRNIYSKNPNRATSLPNIKFIFPKQIFIIPCGPFLPMRPKARVLALISVMPKLISAVY